MEQMEQLVLTVLYQAQILLLSLQVVAVAVAHVHRMVFLEVLVVLLVVVHLVKVVLLEQLIKVLLEETHYVEVVFQGKEMVVVELVVLVLLFFVWRLLTTQAQQVVHLQLQHQDLIQY